MTRTRYKKYKGKLAKESIVFIRHQYGSNVGEVDKSTTYKIKSIGTKRAIVDKLDDKGNVIGYRSRTYYLFDKQTALENTRSFGSTYPYDWAMLFVPLGAIGWDPDFNF